MGNNFYAKIFIATAVIFPLFVVDGKLRVRISGNVKQMPEVGGGKVKSTPGFALPKPGDKLSIGNAHLRILLARTKANKEPEWETAQQAKVVYQKPIFKYEFDFEVTDPDIVGTQYTWGVAAGKKIFELQDLLNQPVKLKVLKKIDKSIDIYVDITGNPTVGLPEKKSVIKNGAKEFNTAAPGIEVIVKLIDPTTRKEFQTQYGVTKPVTAQPPPEVEPEQKRGLFGFKKAPWEGTTKDESPQKGKGLLSEVRKRIRIPNLWGPQIGESKIHPVADKGSPEKGNEENGKPIGTLNGSQAEEQQSQQPAAGKTDEHPPAPVPGEANQANPPAPKPATKSGESGAES